jgi:hypothetical protein
MESKLAWEIPTFLKVSRTAGTKRRVATSLGLRGFFPRKKPGLDVAPSPTWQLEQLRYGAAEWQEEQLTHPTWSR